MVRIIALNRIKMIILAIDGRCERMVGESIDMFVDRTKSQYGAII